MKLLRQIWLVICIFNLSTQLACHAQAAGTNLWKLQLANYDCDSSPALALDGTIYQATFDGKLEAITPQGEIKWTFKTPLEIKSSPAIADDGTIYFGARNRKFYAVTPEGLLKWTFPTGAWIDSSPAIGADGTIYFGSWDKKFYALNPDGSLKWNFVTGGIVVSSPAIGADGTIYYGSHDKYFYALTHAGTLRWKFPTQGQIISSPAINSDGTLYFTSTDGNLYALKPDGTEKWRLHTGGVTESSPALDGQGGICLGASLYNIHVNEDGKLIWEYGAADIIDASPVVTTNRIAYCSTPWREFFAIQADGTLQWHMLEDSRIWSSPVIGGDGTIYATSGFDLCAITFTNPMPSLAKSSWPMFRANPQHTGRVQIVK